MSSKQHVASTILWTPSKGGIVTAVELRIHCIHFYISAFLSLYVLDFHHTAYIFSHSLSFSLFKSLSRRHVHHSLSCTTTYVHLYVSLEKFGVFMIVSNQEREHCPGALDASTPDTIFSTAVLFLLFRARFRGSSSDSGSSVRGSTIRERREGGKAGSGSVLTK